jgi:hypothetical protein
MPETVSSLDFFIYTLPIYNDKENATACRNCNIANEWRCDDGFCIDEKKKGDGIPDCADDSDETPGTVITSSTYFSNTYAIVNVRLSTRIPNTG